MHSLLFFSLHTAEVFILLKRKRTTFNLNLIIWGIWNGNRLLWSGDRRKVDHLKLNSLQLAVILNGKFASRFCVSPFTLKVFWPQRGRSALSVEFRKTARSAWHEQSIQILRVRGRHVVIPVTRGSLLDCLNIIKYDCRASTSSGHNWTLQQEQQMNTNVYILVGWRYHLCMYIRMAIHQYLHYRTDFHVFPMEHTENLLENQPWLIWWSDCRPNPFPGEWEGTWRHFWCLSLSNGWRIACAWYWAAG